MLIDAIEQFEKSIEELEINAEIANHGVCEATEEIISDIRERALETHASFVTTHAIEQAKINIAKEKNANPVQMRRNNSSVDNPRHS